MALRKLTRKSKLDFGRYWYNTIQEIIDEDPQYVAWIYYNKPDVTFFDDILEEIGLVNEFTIDKPGNDPDMVFKEGRKELRSKELTEQERGMNRKRAYWKKKDGQMNAERATYREGSKASIKREGMGQKSFRQ